MAKLANVVEDKDSGIARFTYRDTEYTIDSDLDLDVLEALENEQMVAATRGLLGEAQFKTFKDSFLPGKPKVSHLADILGAATKAANASLGESGS